MRLAIRRWAALAAVASVTAMGAVGCAQTVPVQPMGVQQQADAPIQPETKSAVNVANQRVGLAHAMAKEGKIDEAVKLLEQAGEALDEAGDMQMLDARANLKDVSALIDKTVKDIKETGVNRQEVALIGISQVIDALNQVGIKLST